MKINLSELEQKAKAVNCPETWDSGDFACGLSKHDADYLDAITPMTMLALIRVVRLAKILHTGVFTQDTYMQMREALKEITE